MKIIILTQGKYALVDDEDYEELNEFSWCAVNLRGSFYAMRTSSKEDGGKKVYMHRQILGLLDGDKRRVDHRKHDTLNNTRKNIRICSRGENQHNRKMNKNNISGFKGVGWHKASQKWRSRIRVNGKGISLGFFDTPEEAARVYDEEAKRLFGEFSSTNEEMGRYGERVNDVFHLLKWLEDKESPLRKILTSIEEEEKEDEEKYLSALKAHATDVANRMVREEMEKEEENGK